MSEANVRWLDGIIGEPLTNGTTFGVPWPKSRYLPGQTFVIEGNGKEYPLDSREIGFWPDGSLKWTAHSVSADISHAESYTVKAGPLTGDTSGITVEENAQRISVTTRSGLQLKFSAPGSSKLFDALILNGQTTCSGAKIVASIDDQEYSTLIKRVEVENMTFSRVVIKVCGVVISSEGEDHLPFDVRVYLYSGASSVKILHSFVHDLDAAQPLTSLGLRFSVPLERSEFYNRHIRLGGMNGGILREEVQGLTGLRFGPSIQNRIDQAAGKAVTLSELEWEKTDLKTGLSYIPTWDSYSLSQLSSDGFTVKKRTKKGCAWVKVTGGGRADGTAYLGSARHGGLAVGMSDFWERYPTQLDLTQLTKDQGLITVWLYSPLAEPLDTSPYHDGLGETTHEKQIEALAMTYEDYEPGFVTANGIARTNQIFLQPFTATPSNQKLSRFSSLVRNPPRLVPNMEYVHSTNVFHGYWSPGLNAVKRSVTQKEKDIESRLDILFNYYKGQVEQQRWYGFLDHGDVQHNYDAYRHAWRYDVGGFAWDNSELSTDLWLWLYFLHSGRADVFKMAEAMTRHTGEVDVYHSGRFKGFGTRHGVQHFSDSSKQIRISNVLYRRIYFYLTGDERIGDLMTELQDCQKSLLGLDSHRKVQAKGSIPQGFAMTNIGLDCGALAAAWLTAWERRVSGWEHARDWALRMLQGIASLKHGIGNNAMLLNPTTGEILECPPPTPEYAISHLSMLFGFPEIFSELLDYAKDDHPDHVENFKKVWLSYCRAYNGGAEVQLKEFGFEFPSHAIWFQSHSTLTAYVAVEENNEELAKAAWKQFFTTDGLSHEKEVKVNKASPPEFFCHGEEAPTLRTNDAARYGVSAISNLATIGKYLDS